MYDSEPIDLQFLSIISRNFSETSYACMPLYLLCFASSFSVLGIPYYKKEEEANSLGLSSEPIDLVVEMIDTPIN